MKNNLFQHIHLPCYSTTDWEVVGSAQVYESVPSRRGASQVGRIGGARQLQELRVRVRVRVQTATTRQRVGCQGKRDDSSRSRSTVQLDKRSTLAMDDRSFLNVRGHSVQQARCFGYPFGLIGVVVGGKNTPRTLLTGKSSKNTASNCPSVARAVCQNPSTIRTPGRVAAHPFNRARTTGSGSMMVWERGENSWIRSALYPMPYPISSTWLSSCRWNGALEGRGLGWIGQLRMKAGPRAPLVASASLFLARTVVDTTGGVRCCCYR